MHVLMTSLQGGDPECLENGLYINGACVCNPGYYGPECECEEESLAYCKRYE